MTRVNRSMYFARTVLFTRRGDEVLLVDVHDGSSTPPMEAWLGRVFLLADGSHTVQELIDLVARQYGGRAPPSLEETLDSVVERLLESKIITLSEHRVMLPYYLSIPASEQDHAKASRLMQEDGYEQCSLPQAMPRSLSKRPR